MSYVIYPQYQLPDDLDVNSVTASSGFSGSLYGTASYANNADTLDGISSEAFALKTDVTGALSEYAKASDVSSSFVTNVAATASLAFLTASNTFTAVNTFQTSITGADAFFTGNLYVNGTASIGQVNTVNSNNVVVGDKYISLVNGANTQADVNGAGILWASGSSGGPTGDESSVAHLVYRDAQDQLEIFPGLKVSGSLTASSPSSFTQVTASDGFSGGTFIGTSFSGSSTLQIGGLSTFGGSVIVPMKTVQNDYTLNASTDYIVEFSGSNLTGTLPSAVGINGLSLILKNTHTTPLYITSAVSTIDGQNSLTVTTQYTSYTFVSNNSNWIIV